MILSDETEEPPVDRRRGWREWLAFLLRRQSKAIAAAVAAGVGVVALNVLELEIDESTSLLIEAVLMALLVHLATYFAPRNAT